MSSFDILVVLGATACGKTSLGVRLARDLAGRGRPCEIISADSRQVYRGLDIGSGKDLAEYGEVPYHLVDVATLTEEYNVFSFQRDFYRTYRSLSDRSAFPLMVGGTGMYLDSILRSYPLVEVPENPPLREELAPLTLDELARRLLSVKADIHNRTDLEDRARLVRAIEIAEYERDSPAEEEAGSRPVLRPLTLGVRYPRDELRERIRSRLLSRVEEGLAEEVERLHGEGYSWDRLDRLGLEYRYTARYLQGLIHSRQEWIDSLYTAICQFAKRQETWFRGMERKGVAVRWIERGNYDEARAIVEAELL